MQMTAVAGPRNQHDRPPRRQTDSASIQSPLRSSLRSEAVHESSTAPTNSSPICLHDLGRFTRTRENSRGERERCNQLGINPSRPKVARHHIVRETRSQGSTPSCHRAHRVIVFCLRVLRCEFFVRSSVRPQADCLVRLKPDTTYSLASPDVGVNVPGRRCDG